MSVKIGVRTVMLVVGEKPAKVPVIVAVPFVTPVTTPAAFTLAIVVSLESQVALADWS